MHLWGASSHKVCKIIYYPLFRKTAATKILSRFSIVFLSSMGNYIPHVFCECQQPIENVNTSILTLHFDHFDRLQIHNNALNRQIVHASLAEGYIFQEHLMSHKSWIFCNTSILWLHCNVLIRLYVVLCPPCVILFCLFSSFSINLYSNKK